ncbi:MAG: hypothetical protein JWR10_3812 [Rubritepida sp.]|nr:hypothetical protein [Rubritepida sp.]
MRLVELIMAASFFAMPAMAAAPRTNTLEHRFGQWTVRGPEQGYCHADALSISGYEEISFYIAIAADGPRFILARQMLSQQQFFGASLQQNLRIQTGAGTALLRVTFSRPESFAAVFETVFDPSLFARPGAIEIRTSNNDLVSSLSGSGAAAAARAMAACLAGSPLP